MTTSIDTPGRDERLDLLDGLIYSDVFDCALTLEELWRYCRVPVEREELARRLHGDPALRKVVTETDGLYCLAGRAELIEARRQGMARASVLSRRARRVAGILRALPFIRGLVLTGSAAAEDGAEDADVDVLVLVAPRRLGIVFVMLGPASRLLGRRFFCPNYYVSDDCLEMGPPNIYVARELTQARSLVGDARRLREANPWLADVFPNAGWPGSPDGGWRPRPSVQRLLEAPLRGSFGDRIERAAHRLAERRLRAHHHALGETVPPDVAAAFEADIALRFHRGNVDETSLDRYLARCEEVSLSLAGADTQLVRPAVDVHDERTARGAST